MSMVLSELLASANNTPLKGPWAEGNVDMLEACLSKEVGLQLSLRQQDSDIVVEDNTDKLDVSVVRKALQTYFVVQDLKPSTAKSTHVEPAAVSPGGLFAGASDSQLMKSIVLLYLKPSEPVQTNMTAAKTWITQLLPSELREFVQKVRIIHKGHTLKIHMLELPFPSSEPLIQAALTSRGKVAILTGDKYEQQISTDKSFAAGKKRQIDSVGNVQQSGAVLDKILTLNGTAGSQKKNRRLARTSAKIYRTAQKAASAGVKELASSESEDESDQNQS